MIRLTNSEAKDWRRCKRKWYLGYYRGLQKEDYEFNRPLSIGSRIHTALQNYYIPGLERPDPIDSLEETVEKDIAKHPAFEEDIQKEAELCRIMLEGYLDWLEETGEDAPLRVIEPEAEMEAPLIVREDGTIDATLLSKIDARIERESDGKRLSLEHKTVQNLKDPLPTLQVDTQLLTEHLVEFLSLMESESGDIEANRAHGVLYNMLRKVKRTAQANPPFYGREEVTHTTNELRYHWRHTVRIAKEILAAREELDQGTDHHDVCPPNLTRDCSWDCPFKEPCLGGVMDSGQDPEPMFQDLYVVGDPLERYRTTFGLSTNT